MFFRIIIVFYTCRNGGLLSPNYDANGSQRRHDWRGTHFPVPRQGQDFLRHDSWLRIPSILLLWIDGEGQHASRVDSCLAAQFFYYPMGHAGYDDQPLRRLGFVPGDWKL